MGKRGKRRRRSRDAKREASNVTTIGDSGGVAVTSSDGSIVEAWPSNVFHGTTLGDDSAVCDLHRSWQTLEQRKRRRLTPTPIQVHTWPILTQNCHPRRSMVGIAPTGSGKTLAYGLVLVSQNHCGNALVLVPTRELACQVQRDLVSVSDKKIMCIYGGVDRSLQVAALTEAMNKSEGWIVTATTGRIDDVLQDDSLPDFVVDSIVLDEADRMASNVDMARQVDDILQKLRRKSSSIRLSLFSATFPSNVQDKWNEWMGESRIYIRVNTVTVGEKPVPSEEGTAQEYDDTEPDSAMAVPASKELNFSKIPGNVNQVLHVCGAHKKPRKLITTLQKIRKDEGRQRGLCLVFFARIKTLEYVSKVLTQEGKS